MYFASSKYHDEMIIRPEDADIAIEGYQAYSWFGYHSLVVEENSMKFLVVGAPVTKVGDLQSAGAVFGFDLSTDFSKPEFVVFGQNEFDQFGFTFDSGNLLGGW